LLALSRGQVDCRFLKVSQKHVCNVALFFTEL
jgi:hypothetical protein